MILRKNLDNLKATERLAKIIASNIRGGEVIELVSDVGGGKTTFTKFLVRALGSYDTVSSPTFTVSRVYSTPTKTIYHYDFYRLSDPQYVLQALQEQTQDSSTITIIEWGGIVKNVLPANRLIIKISKHPTNETARIVNFEVEAVHDYLLRGIK